MSAIDTIDRELQSYRSDLGSKPQILVVTKADAIQDQTNVGRLRERAAELGRGFLVISSVSGQGIPELIRVVGQELDRARAATAREAES